MIEEYLNSLIGEVYKILPLKEDEDSGKAVFLSEYLKSLNDDLNSATVLFPVLHKNPHFCKIQLGVIWLLGNPCTQKECKVKVFKLINHIKKIQEVVISNAC